MTGLGDGIRRALRDMNKAPPPPKDKPSYDITKMTVFEIHNAGFTDEQIRSEIERRIADGEVAF